MKKKLSGYILAAVMFGSVVCPAADPPAYTGIKKRLIQGWNTWHSRNVLCHVKLPEAAALNLCFKQQRWLSEPYLREGLIGRRGNEKIRPGLHSLNGNYTELFLEWQELDAVIESARTDEDLVILITPRKKQKDPVRLVLEMGMLWNRTGNVLRRGNSLEAVCRNSVIKVFPTRESIADPYVPSVSSYLVVPADRQLGISTGRMRSLHDIVEIVREQRRHMQQRARRFAPLHDAALALETGIAWNTIYEPRHNRVVSTVGRLWNLEYGGYCLFGWDNFFLAYVASLFSRDVAFANVIEHVRGRTAEGFVPNDNRGNGSKSFDRSQPPVGGLMVREIFRRFPETWFLQEVFPGLLKWNRWWVKKRLNRGLLSYGSHPAANPFNEPDTGTKKTAGYESGMDDSPMYDGVPFNKQTHTLELQDVGLNSLYIADCHALAELAQILGKKRERRELENRARMLKKQMSRLYDPGSGLYLNRRTDTGELSARISPTVFYPLLAGVARGRTARRMVRDHLKNPGEFWGEWVIPSVPRNDPDFFRQRYWKGAIWPPLNFLTYLGLRKAGFLKEAGELADKSLKLFMKEWRSRGYISENYSSISGTGDDKRLSSDRFHSWGTLMGIMAFIEQGRLAFPEQKIIR